MYIYKKFINLPTTYIYILAWHCFNYYEVNIICIIISLISPYSSFFFFCKHILILLILSYKYSYTDNNLLILPFFLDFMYILTSLLVIIGSFNSYNYCILFFELNYHKQYHITYQHSRGSSNNYRRIARIISTTI